MDVILTEDTCSVKMKKVAVEIDFCVISMLLFTASPINFYRLASLIQDHNVIRFVRFYCSRQQANETAP